VEDVQVKRLNDVKATRDQVAVDEVLGRLRREAADPEVNLMPALVDAATARATLGEVCSALGEVFGWWEETPVI
jgi:methylmalonyl-CoA mutase N-terminal domain/subunit